MRFGWFGDQEHRVFNYRPCYYDEEQEELKQKFGHVDGTLEKEAKEKKYVPGSIIQGSMRDGNYAKRKGGSKAAAIISIVGMVLFAVILIMITRFYSLL